MPFPICRHVKTNGLQCQSPALNASIFCYFHTRLHQRHARFRHTPATQGYLIPGKHIELCPIEDRESVQFALSVVINSLATGAIEPVRANALLYGLQLASQNAVNLNLKPYAAKCLRDVHPSPPEDELPGIDLAKPGLTAD